MLTDDKNVIFKAHRLKVSEDLSYSRKAQALPMSLNDKNVIFASCCRLFRFVSLCLVDAA